MPINLSTMDNQFRFRPALNGGGLRTKIYPEAANANFRYGEPVTISSSGGVDSVTHISAAPGADAVTNPVQATMILGFALGHSANTSGGGTPVPILLADGCEVLTRVNGGTLADVNVGDKAEVGRYRAGTVATNIFMVVSSAPIGTDALNKAIITEKYSQNNSAVNAAFQGEQSNSDTNALVWVKLRPGHIAQHPA